MPAFETMDLHDTAVLWVRSGKDKYNEPTVTAPIEVMVRWTFTDSRMVNKNGDEVQLDAEVVVSRDVPYDSLLWLGTLSDWQGVGSGGQDTELMQVKVKRYAQDIKGRNTRRTLGLMRYKNKP